MPSPSDTRHPGTCRHCGRKCKVLYPRGLCHEHYYGTPAVRALYPSLSVFHGARMSGWADDHQGDDGPPAEATEALPGTEKKLEALATRFSRREALWRDDDKRRSLA